MLAIEDSASIFWARVMRGTWSIASTVTLRAASRSTRSLFLPGQRKLMSTAPGFSRSTSSALGGCTLSSTSASDHSAAPSAVTVAPALT